MTNTITKRITFKIYDTKTQNWVGDFEYDAKIEWIDAIDCLRSVFPDLCEQPYAKVKDIVFPLFDFGVLDDWFENADESDTFYDDWLHEHYFAEAEREFNESNDDEVLTIQEPVDPEEDL